MPRTRQRARSEVSATPNTPTTVVSPLFSARTSEQATPDTSDIDAELPKLKPTVQTRRTTRMSTIRKGTKRALESEKELDDDAPAIGKPTKRRVITKEVYVEISVPKRIAKKTTPIGKQSVSGQKSRQAGRPIQETEVDYENEANPAQEDVQSGEELSIDESDDSGSEYQGSDDDELAQNEPLEASDDDDILEEGINDEDVMMDAAIKMSLDLARTVGKAGSSSTGATLTTRSTSISKAAALRAAAAERRLGCQRTMAVEDEAPDFLASDLEESAVKSSDESEEEPLAKGKGKGKGVARKVTVTDTSKPKNMTIAELRQVRREQRRKAKLMRGAHSKEEADLRLKLGRKLTHAEKTSVALRANHPELRNVWGDLEKDIPIAIPQKAEQPPNLKVTLLPFQLESIHWMRDQEKGIWKGGILADEMGMGKTIQMISLLVSHPGSRPNLVVAPTVAIMQWRNEIETRTDGMKVLIWHGSSRESDVRELKKYDVVLTTYAVLESSFRKQHSGFKRKSKIVKEASAIHAIKWVRIILDEAHNIKERATNTAKATFELKSEYKWCLSGTPLQNRVGELYSLVRFLGGDPFSFYFCKMCDCKSLHWKFSDKRSCDDCGHSPMKHTCFWNTEILTPIQKNGMLGPGKDAFKKLRILLDRMMLRRTKIQRADDLGLPPRTVIIRRDYFSPEEKELYLSLFSDAKRQFNTYVDSGTVLNNYSNIFSLLTRMRQMACHPDLVLRSKTNAGAFVQDEAGEATVCRLCNDVAEDAIQAKCRHIFDRECIKQYLNTAIEMNPACPVCHLPLTIDLEAPALEVEVENATPRQGILGRLDLDKWRSSSKIEALIEELTNLRRQDATTKSIVFSQFVNFLDLIAYRLQKCGFNVCRLEGTMSPQARDATIQYFMNNVHVTVFLVSLKAGGVALNLTEASRVFLMDSWWNPAVEYQAMDRIHRLGQHRPVQVVKLVVEDSIESRIVQLQEKKAAMVDATLSTDDSAMGRLTPGDLNFLFRL
ncbi:DNA repair protein [Sparassis crispa]|uniref:DNA repair protein n=1 Tax=Sparassis crispa TaxID=139825 RepID=A0A401GAA9_9APHY|nr:DNA repair protein [Sparassis crispa]GBE79098.1 DNA repair protein [Sparassis crispa]